MTGVLSRVSPEGTVGARRVSTAGVIDRLTSGEGPAAVAAALGLEAADVVAAVAHEGLAGDGPALVQTSPRRPELALALGEPALVGLFPRARRPALLSLAAGLLQVTDFWDASHTAAQQADDLGETRLSAYWHGIAHRREPDAGNAAYWFRRVGRHPLFPDLARAARDLLESLPSGDAAPAARVVSGGTWDAFAFIDLCTRPREAATLARALQRLEMDLLLGASIPA